MDKQIDIQVIGKCAVSNYSKEVVCGNSDYTVKFDFSEADESFNKYNDKTALFVYGKNTTPVIFQGDTCPMPPLSNCTECLIGLIAGNVHTTTAVKVRCFPSISDFGGTIVPPTEDVYNQIMEILNRLDPETAITEEEIKQIIAEATSALESRIEELEKNVTGGGLTEDEVKEIVSEETKNLSGVKVSGEFVKEFDADTKLDKGNGSWDRDGGFNVTQDIGDDYTARTSIGKDGFYVYDGKQGSFKHDREGVKTTNVDGTSRKFKYPTYPEQNAERTFAMQEDTVERVTSTSGFERVYGIGTDGKQKVINTSVNPAGFGTLVKYYDSGKLKAEDGAEKTEVVNYRQLKANAIDPIADHEKRIKNLESTLLTYIEDSTSAYQKVVPVGAATNAVLSNISGVTKTSNNFLDPSLFTGASVGEDGSIRVSYDFGDNPFYSEYYADVTLPAGTYYLKTNSTVISGENATVHDASFENAYSEKTEISLAEETEVRIGFWIEGGGFTEADVYVMLSTDPNAEFEPFGAERYGAVSKIISKGANDKEIDTFEIPSQIQSVNGYGKEGFVFDLNNKTTNYNGTVTDVSAYLHYPKYKTIKVEGGGVLEFISEYKLAIPSTVTYVKKKE